MSDAAYINRYPRDAAEIARLVRQADEATAVRLLQVWGSKQRDIGSLKALGAIDRIVLEMESPLTPASYGGDDARA